MEHVDTPAVLHDVATPLKLAPDARVQIQACPCGAVRVVLAYHVHKAPSFVASPWTVATCYYDPL
jgi:hypothetical protein